MRLTGGTHSRRQLHVPATGIRPTQDQVRAAIFSSLATHVPGSRVLDLFAGTGAMGLEAWSRGAAWVEWVENDRQALRAIRKNRCNLKVPPDAGRLRVADVFSWLSRACPGPPFDLVFSDPPYAVAIAHGWQQTLAQALATNGWLTPDSIWTYETEGRQEPPDLPGWRLLRDKTYGTTRVLIRQQENGSEPSCHF